MWQSVREVLVSIHTKFDVSRCLVCPTIEINICSILLIKKCYKPSRKWNLRHVEDSPSTKGSLEKKSIYNTVHYSSLTTQIASLVKLLEMKWKMKWNDDDDDTQSHGHIRFLNGCVKNLAKRRYKAPLPWINYSLRSGCILAYLVIIFRIQNLTKIN